MHTGHDSCPPPQTGATRGQGRAQQQPPPLTCQVCSCKAPIRHLAGEPEPGGHGCGRTLGCSTAVTASCPGPKWQQQAGVAPRPGQSGIPEGNGCSAQRPQEGPELRPTGTGPEGWPPCLENLHPALRRPPWSLSPLCQSSDCRARSRPRSGSAQAAQRSPAFPSSRVSLQQANARASGKSPDAGSLLSTGGLRPGNSPGGL